MGKRSSDRILTMRTRCRAEHTGFGVILSGIAGRQSAERLRDFFARNGLAGIVTPFVLNGQYCVSLIGATLEEFHRVADRAGIEFAS